MANKEDLAKRIGRRVREIRQDRGMSQKMLAEAAGLSTPLISRIENGLAMPSIPTLQSIADHLGVDIGFFFRGERQEQFVISPKAGRRTMVSARGYDNIELLVEGMENAFMEPAIVTAKGKNHEDEVELALHDGQEFVYVLEGKIEITLGNNKYILKKGDAAYWYGSVPHKGISLSKKPAKTLNIHFVPGKMAGTFKTKLEKLNRSGTK